MRLLNVRKKCQFVNAAFEFASDAGKGGKVAIAKKEGSLKH